MYNSLKWNEFVYYKTITEFYLECAECVYYQASFTLSVLEVMSPQWSDLVLTTHIPHSETNVLIFYSLNIKTWKEIQKVN